MTVNTAEDVVEVLSDQHQRLRQLCADVRASSGDDKKRLFGELAHLVHMHELGERTVVHPVTRDHTFGGGAVIAETCAVSEDRVAREIAELQDLGVDHPAFDAKFAAFRDVVLDHAAYEERDEFPRLRQYISTQRLHMMASELRNVQTMS